MDDTAEETMSGGQGSRKPIRALIFWASCLYVIQLLFAYLATVIPIEKREIPIVGSGDVVQVSMHCAIDELSAVPMLGCVTFVLGNDVVVSYGDKRYSYNVDGDYDVYWESFRAELNADGVVTLRGKAKHEFDEVICRFPAKGRAEKGGR